MAVQREEPSATGYLARPEWKRDGDSFTFIYRDYGIGIGIDNLRERSGELHGQVTVEEWHPNGPGGHLHWAGLNLSSTQARSTLAKALAPKAAGLGMPWGDALDQVVAITAREWNAPEPTLDLSTYEGTTATEYAVAPILPRGESTILYADSGSGKSYLALALAFAVRAGILLPHGIKASAQGAVLYLDAETTFEAHAKRARRLAYGFGMSHVPKIYYRRLRRPLVDEVRSLRAEVSRLGISLVIVDSLGFASGDDPREAGIALRTMAAMNDIGVGVTKLGLAHVTKNEAAGTSAATIFGSAFWRASARSAWELRRANDHRGRMDLALFNRKANDDEHGAEPLGLSLEFTPEGGPIYLTDCRIEDVEGLAEHLPIGQRLVAMLRDGSRSTGDLANAVGVSQDTVRKTLNRRRDVVGMTEAGGRGVQQVWHLVPVNDHAV